MVHSIPNNLEFVNLKHALQSIWSKLGLKFKSKCISAMHCGIHFYQIGYRRSPDPVLNQTHSWLVTSGFNEASACFYSSPDYIQCDVELYIFLP